MRLRHQLAHTFQVALLQRAGSFNGAGVFSQDVTHAFRDDRVQFMCNSVELFNGDIAQSWLLEETRTGFALFTTGVVFAANRGVRLKLLLMMTTATPFGMNSFGPQ